MLYQVTINFRIQLQINVMNNLEELLALLENKISHYRKAKSHIKHIHNQLQPFRQSQSHAEESFSCLIQTTLNAIKEEAAQTVTAVGSYCQNLLQKQSQTHHQEIQQLRMQIARQYKLNTLLRKEFQDLMELMNQRNSQEKPEVSCSQQESSQHSQVSPYQAENMINGLQVIQEEETQRTLLSSVHSFNQDRNTSNFIRIQEKSRYSSLEQSVQQLESEQNLQFQDHRHATINSEDNEWPSNCRFQGLLESAASQNVNTQHNDQAPQWQSMPASVQASNRCEGLWEAEQSNELKDITNQCEQERQKKTKLFLQEFRKTFNKCLSANVSRKGSNAQTKPSKDKVKSTNTFNSFMEKHSANSQNDSQRLINEMLKDIDNNTKFFVGNRKFEVKYQGEKRDGVRCGHGVLYYSNGLCYEGNFKNNLRHGFGVLRFNQIEIYRGTWSADELSGQGKIRNFAVINKRKTQGGTSVLSRWVSYCGSFKGNRFEGEGTLYLQGGQKFLGKFICGSACGEGSFFRKSGEVETGVWRNNQLVQQF